MSCQITSLSHESSLSSRGQASIDRWAGLKEWHRRHQELLQNRVGSGNSNLQNAGSQNPIITNHADHDSVGERHISLKHDLSVISEGDEDSRTKDNDRDSTQSAQSIRDSDFTAPSVSRNMESSLAPYEKMDKDENVTNKKPFKIQEDSSNHSEVVTKRPFLRRGQGLVRYNMKAEDVMHPYQKYSCKRTKTQVLPKKTITSSFPKCDKRIMSDHLLPNISSHVLPKPKSTRSSISNSVVSLSAPMQQLVLTAPVGGHQHSSTGTWSQVLKLDENKSTDKPQHSVENGLHFNKGKDSVSEEKPKGNETDKILRLPSIREKQHSHCSLGDEEQDSLAAYIDLEQHIGNASFCSTSSKVDRLVAKSSETSLHPSNPDAITQSKPKSPLKTSKGFPAKSAKNSSVWSETDLCNLLKSCNWGSRRADDESKTTAALLTTSSDNNHTNLSENVKSSIRNDSEPPEDSSHENRTDIDFLLEQISQARKPHLMKTMPSIDLDSSLVRNGIALTSQGKGKFIEFDAGSDLCASSGESDTESSTSSESSTLETHASSNKRIRSLNYHVSDNDISKDSIPTNIFMDPAAVDGINQQIESHLNELKKEIKSLQEAKSKSQKHVSALEKKVLELEHRLVLEARSFSKRLEEEKQSADKKLQEEQAKFQKEKSSLQKTIREQRKHLADPVTQQELMRLKQEVAQWEEKWRLDRAKARGQESNLRIHITNLKKENEKLRDANDKLRREKETAINAAKAKAVTNTRAINSIAQQLGKNKSKSSLYESTPNQNTLKETHQKILSPPQESSYNLHNSAEKHTLNQCVTSIGTFPKSATCPDEWASEDEIDFGKDESNEEESLIITGSQVVSTERNKHSLLSERCNQATLNTSLQRNGELLNDSLGKLTDFTLEEAQAKYNALFGVEAVETSDLSSNTKFHSSCTESASLTNPHDEKIPTQSENFVETVHYPDGKVEQVKKSGTRVITYPDGTWERRSSSGSVMTVPPCGWPIHILYFNGDQLEKLEDGTVRYFYAKSNTWQTTFPDGHEELLYPSGEVEHRAKDGSTKVSFPDTSEAVNTQNSSTGSDNLHGICIEKDSNGDTVILFTNGERELHTKEFMRKDFLDGTVKFVYQDGSQETRYPSGRIRIKDGQGNLIKDTCL